MSKRKPKYSVRHRPRKRFGQHFLHDAQVLDRIVRAVYPKKGEHIVEIGPGLGALTQHLLKQVSGLDVIELDRDVIPKLVERCGHLGELRVHSADVLRVDFTQLATHGEPLRLVGNLPYNISTPLLFHLLTHAPVIKDMHFMLQKEVADRLGAQPDTHHYGRLSVMIQYRCQVQPLFMVTANAFTPPPKVNSAVVRIIPYRVPPYVAADESFFAQLVNRAFSHRRKTLRNALKDFITTEELISVDIDPTARPETLGVSQFVKLSNALDVSTR